MSFSTGQTNRYKLHYSMMSFYKVMIELSYITIFLVEGKSFRSSIT